MTDGGGGSGLLRPSPLTVRDPIRDGAEWITSAEHRRSGTVLPVLACIIEVTEPLSGAILSVACLGVMRATIDGVAVAPDVLEPGYAEWRHEAEYTGWDVLRMLPPGRHVLRFDLGGGMYRSLPQDDRWSKITNDIGDVTVAATLTLAGPDAATRVIVSDRTWNATTGAVTTSGFFGGEDYDARLEPDASPEGVAEWPPAVPAVVPPGIRLVPKTTAPVRIVDELPAVTVSRAADALVVDFGQNTAGWPVIDLPPQTTVRLRPAELLDEDGSVDVRTQGWGPVFHTVRTGSQAMTWRPSFMYNGLRYLEVTGIDHLDPTDVGVEVLAAAVDRAGDFGSSDERLNAIWRITGAAIRSNMMSVFTDCPQREKLGYLEQIHLLHDLLVRTYHCEPILDRMLELAVGAQRNDGSIGLYAPEWQEFPDPWRGDPNWGGAVVLLALARYRATGALDPIRSAYPAMLRYVDFLLADRDDDGVARYGLGDFNGASVKKFRNVPLVSTASLHKLLLAAADCAALVDDTEVEARLRDSALAVAEDFRRAFLGSDGRIGDGGVAELVFALDAGLAPASAIDLIDGRIRADDYVLDIGEVAMALLVDLLADAGRHETLLGITRVTDAPSYGYMLAHGATTLTETWDGPTFGFSQNHFMNGAIGSWFHRHLVGIRQDEGSVGWSAPLIAPVVVGDLRGVDGWYETPHGRIAVSWRLVDGIFVVEGCAPRAVLQLPSGRRIDVAGEFRYEDPMPV